MSKDNQPVEQQTPETSDDAAKKLYPIDGYMTEVDKYTTYSKRHGFVCGSDWKHAHTIQVIENRIAELEIEMFDNNQSFEWNLIKQGELKLAKDLLKQLQP